MEWVIGRPAGGGRPIVRERSADGGGRALTEGAVRTG